MKLARDGSSGPWMVADRSGHLEVRFQGRGNPPTRAEALDALGDPSLDLAWCRQVHSSRTVNAETGECGEADGLITRRRGLALSLVTADCVPVVFGSETFVAAVHAGWRGIAGGIVTKALDDLPRAELIRVVAWLGPAIGPCCYEVDSEVADQVVAASGPSAHIRRKPRPHLDLHEAVEIQLRSRGVETVYRAPQCTQCEEEALWSYRREGKRAGRNLTFAWLRPLRP